MKNQIRVVKKLLANKIKKNVTIKKYQNLWFVEQVGPESSVLIYNQLAWDEFVNKVIDQDFDDLLTF